MRGHSSTVLAKDSKDNAIANAVASAQQPNQSYFVTGVNASYSIPATNGLLQIKDDATVIFEQYVHGHLDFCFPSAIEITLGKPVSATLAASGTAATIGKVNLLGFVL